MAQIVTKDYFNKNNGLYIPLSVVNPTTINSQATPNNSTALDALCVKIEKKILLNALGLTLYKELQTALLNLTTANQKWQDLVNGVDYGEKQWIGLKHNYSLIAWSIYENYLTENNEYLSAIGTVKVDAENANNVVPNYKIANANQSFIEQYQGDVSIDGRYYIIDGITFVDYLSNDEIEVSLFKYLTDKKDDFTWTAKLFKIYETKNSFDL
jgi:hypothetical protein